MLLPGDLGFRVVLVFVFVVFPAVFLFLRRKWRLAVARTDEINRLLVLAAEEAARAELEESIEYGYGPASYAPVNYLPVSNAQVNYEPVSNAQVNYTVTPIIQQRVCAVCCAPTAHRCARCKSVHYCSGKCQIIHWRQGHKDECRPLPDSFEVRDETNSFTVSAVKSPHSYDYAGHIEEDGLPCDEQSESGLEKPRFSSAAHYPLRVSAKDVKASVIHSPHEEEPGSIFKLNDSSVSSGVHTSSSPNHSCIEDSLSDNDGLHDADSDSCDFSSTFENFETASSERQVEQSKPLAKEFSMRMESVGRVPASGGLEDETVSGMTDSSGLKIGRSDKNLLEPSISTSGFWDGTLDTNRIQKYIPSNNGKPKLGGSGNGDVSESKSTMQFSSNLSDSFSSGTRSRISEASGETYPSSSRAVEVAADSSLQGKESTDVLRHQSSTVSSSKRLEPGNKRVNSKGNLTEAVKVGAAAKSSKDSPLLSPERTSDLGRTKQDTLQTLVSKKAALSPIHSNGTTSSGMNGRSVPAVKSTKAIGTTAMPAEVDRSTPSAAVGLKTSVLKVVGQFRAPRLSKYGDIVGRNSEKAIFPYELFVKLYHWNKVELRPCGLINCGNSCYANVVLQCLAVTPPLTAYLLQGLHTKECAKKEWCFTCEFERLIIKGKEEGRPLTPIGILSQIQKIGSHLTNGREEDAHEFLRYAIETMQSICFREAGVKGSSSLEEETTLLGLTFGGYLRSKIKCTKCHGKSERQERMMDLTVEIEGDIETLEDALRRFTGTESLDGENKYHCGRCKSYEKAKKKLSILEAPNILTIALKRFQSGKFGKLNKSIRFPEILNLAPYMRGGSDKSPIYRLYGVVVHLDIMNASFSGHYVCYVRNAQNKWYKIDDSSVSPVELERVLNKGAYMLFYSRCSPRAPRSIRSTITSQDLPSKLKYAEVHPSRSNGRISTARQRDPSASSVDPASGGYVHQDETRRPVPNFYDFDSSSDNSSLFSNSDETSTSTDSTRESISADDISEYIFGNNAFFPHSTDSDTSSSSSSSSSSPQYMKRSPLSNPERYASGVSEQSVLTDNIKERHETCRAEESGSVGGVTFLHSNSSKQGRNLVNSSSSREANVERLGWANPLDNGKSGVYLRRSSRKKPD